jgi:hypothetical protein
MRNFKLFAQFLALMTGLLFFAGCQQDETVSPADATIDERNSSFSAFPNVNFYGLGTANDLYTYRSGPPATYMGQVRLTGLRDGEFMQAIDVRPATKGLYGVSNMSIIYQINPATGVATPLSQVPFTPAIEGTTVGFDFNPSIDRIRLVTDSGQNLRISPVTGMVVGVDVSLGGAVVAINSAAYSNNFVGSFNPSLYDIDILQGNLYRQNANAGGLTLVGSTGLTIRGEGGFDISRTGAAFGVFLATGGAPYLSSTPVVDDPTQEAYRLYSINLKSGQATNLGPVRDLIGIAIAH